MSGNETTLECVLNVVVYCVLILSVDVPSCELLVKRSWEVLVSILPKSWGPLVEGVWHGACWERGGLGKSWGPLVEGLWRGACWERGGLGKSWGPLVEGVGRGACWERGGLHG